MSTVTLFSLHIIFAEVFKESHFFIVFHHFPSSICLPWRWDAYFLAQALSSLSSILPVVLSHVLPVSGDQNIEADIYCGVGNKGKEAASAGRNILSDWLNAFLFLLYVHFTLCSSALQFASLVVTSAWFLFIFLVNYASLLPSIMFCLITFIHLFICTHVSILVVWLRILCVLTVYVVVSCHSKSIGIQRGSLSLCCSHLCSLGDTV